MPELDVLEEAFPGLAEDKTQEVEEEADYTSEEQVGVDQFLAFLEEARGRNPTKTLASEPKNAPALKTVSVHLPNVGRIDYEVEDYVKTKYAVSLVFDVKRSKPPFYPEVGLQFEVEAGSNVWEVMYTGTCFDYGGKRFMSFSVIQ
jgi:hypothetical protein